MTQANDRAYGHHIRDLTIGKVLAAKAAANGDKVFLNYLPDGTSFSYRKIDSISNRIANRLAGLGVQHGMHVAIVMENSPEQLFSYFGLGKLGAVSVPLNTAAKGVLLKYFLSHSDAEALIIDAAFVPVFMEVQPELPKIRLLIVRGDLEPVVPNDSGLQLVAFADLYEGADSAPAAEVRFSDLAFINYTSGTTGPSKGVMFTQARALLWGLSHAHAFGQRASDVVYICLPMFHVNALQGASYNALMVDASIALQQRFSASRFWSDIGSTGATVTNLLGSMINILWSRPPAAEDSRHKLRMCMSVPIPAFGSQFEERFNMRFTSGYSLTDFGPSHAFSLIDRADKLGSSGRVREGIQARIVDADDFELPPGARGELILRADKAWHQSSGYYNMAEATMASWRNGWFHTGDRGYIDEDGYFWFLDRSKDAIRRRGENISAFEVEQVLLQHPAIEDLAVFAVASSMSEEEIAAAIILRPGMRVSEEELIGYCSANMAYFMVPRYIALVDTLPRNLSHKIEKFVLRKAAEADPGLYWDREAAGIKVSR